MHHCKHCLQSLPVTWVQQGGCHIWCFDEWFDKEIPVWKVEVDGSHYLESNLGMVTDMLSDMDESSYYKITKTKVKQGIFESLPEFTGF